jgi:hypothetical protein
VKNVKSHTVQSYINSVRRGAAFAACGFAFALASGCDKEEAVRAYSTPKESVTAVAATEPAAPAASSGPTWTVPAGWKQLPAQQMRFAAFAVSSEHPDVVATVVPLGAQAGTLAANVVRWQGQIGMPATPENEIEKLVTHADVNGLHVDKVDLTGPDAAPGADKPRQRILAAVIPATGRTWFFKLMGPADVVAAQKANFDAFVDSVKFSAAPAEQTNSAPLSPSDARTPAPRVGAPAGDVDVTTAAAAPSRITYGALPAGWTAATSAAPPRVASFKVEASGQQAELAVTKFPGTAIGTFADNINRWRGQIGLAPVADASGYTPKVTTLGAEQWAIVDVAGEDKPNEPGSAQRILVGMATPGGAAAREIWFFKLQGPSKLVADQRPAFEKFLETVKFAPAE